MLAMSTLMTGCGSKEPGSGQTDRTQTSDSNSETSNKTYKIGVIEAFTNDESTTRMEYFNKYLGPKYNCEFMFSEACTSLDSAMTFVENCADAGCNAILNFYALDANTEQLVLLCKENDMLFVENCGRTDKNESAYTSGYDNFCGGFMADQEGIGKLFNDYLLKNLNKDEKHGFLMITGNAYQGARQHVEISKAMLNAIQEVYGLKFDSSIEELYSSSSPISATNDLGYEVYIYPGAEADSGWLEGISAALQTGKYDYVLSANSVTAVTGAAVPEAEEVLNKDIKIIGFGMFGDGLTTAMTTNDEFGNPIVSMSTVKFSTIVSAMGFSKLYNGLTGHNDINRDKDGVPAVDLFQLNPVTSGEELTQISKWDKTDHWVADYGFIDSILGVNHSDLTDAQFQENINSLTIENVQERLK